MTTQPEYFCDGGFVESSDRHFTMYEPVSFLPYSVYRHLREQSEKDDRDYIKEFDIAGKLKKARVIVAKSYFHNDSNDDSKRNAFVVENDVVIIEVIRKDWVKVAYEGAKVITDGWLKRSEVGIVDNLFP